jgi:peptidyl carrier protein
MLQAKPIVDRLTEFIGGSFLEKDDGQLTADTPLLELNILDSASLFDVVDFVRNEWRVHIPANEIHPGNFASITQLDHLINRLLKHEATK